MKRQGRKSAAQTPAPKSEKIYGSSKNPKGSAMSKKSGSSIKFTEDIINGLEKKVKEHNEKYPSKKVRLSTLKAVFRRGAGAYSSSHRPTITGGAPNTRTAWSYARVNKFLEKKAGKKVKAAYIQDDDLLKNGGVTNQNVICQRCGWSWNTKDSDASDKYVCHKCGHDNSWYYGNELNNKGLLKSIYPIVKESLSAHGLIIDENYNLSEGSNKTFLPYFGMERHNDRIKKITLTYYEDEMDVLGEIEVEVEDDGVEVEMDFPKFGIKEEIESFEKGGKMKEHIALPDSYSTYDKLEPILSKQGYVLKKKKDMLPVGKLAKGKTLIQIAKMHKVKFNDLAKELTKGIKKEMEHTDDKAIAKAIAMDHLYEDPKYYTKLAKMESSKKYESGGEVAHVSGKAGGYLVGRRHSEGGIKAVNKSNNQPLEMEGGEVVITRNAVSDNQKREFEGEMLTNREILSRINQSGGGVAFEKGGDVPSKCACRGKKYKYGGKMMSDFDIVGEINRYGQVPMKLAEKPIDMTGVKFADIKPSEAVKKLFRVDKLADGGIMEDIGDSVVLVTKKIPSLKGFTKMMKIVQSPFEGDNSFFVPIKKGYEIIYQRDGDKGGEKITKAEAYKTYLFDEFGIKFKDLPSKIQNALFLGNQQLIDNYING